MADFYRVGPALARRCQTGQTRASIRIQSGLAWHYKKYEREQSTEDRVAYARAEETARAGRRGLWCRGFPRFG